ncbi:MAG: hypothetical protein AAB067_02155, partial [Planctomycetota bacterium]
YRTTSIFLESEKAFLVAAIGRARKSVVPNVFNQSAALLCREYKDNNTFQISFCYNYSHDRQSKHKKF